MQDDITFTLPLSEREFWTLVFLLCVIALSALVWWITLHRTTARRLSADWPMKALGGFASVLTPIWAALIFFVLYALWRLAWAFPHLGEGAPGVDLLWGALRLDGSGGADALRWHVLALVGLLTALAGLLGIPLALIRVMTTERQTRATEEGLITERINTAVQGLGAEKKVDRIGRSVTVKRGGTWDTRIQRQHEAPNPETGEEIEGKGDWQVFSETLPNLEVRIGAIYALERIAQDSDRDHVQIMEILCAYIRENAPAGMAAKNPKLIWDTEWKRLENEGVPEETIPHEIHARTRISLDKIEPDALEEWARNRLKPRTDVQTALSVIGRRSPRQIELEKASGSSRHDEGYRLDLRETNLQSANLAQLDLRTALLSKARMEGAYLRWAQLQGADLGGAQLQGADLWRAQLQGADLWIAQLQGAYLWEAHLQGANLVEAQLQGADLLEAQLQGADLGRAQLQGAYLLEAQLQGAYLWEAQFSDATSFRPATLRGAGLKDVDLSMLTFDPDHLKETFGDSDVILPEGYPRPAHWRPKDAEPLEWFQFQTEWRAFQDRIGYVPHPAESR